MKIISFIKKTHWPFILMLILISSIGVALLYSIADGQWSPWALRQIIRIVIGSIFLLIVTQIHIQFWYRHAYHFYFFCILLIFLTLLLLDIKFHNYFYNQKANLQKTFSLPICLQKIFDHNYLQ